MLNLELPLKKRSKKYRFFEILPALLSFGSILILIILSFVDSFLASAYLLIVIVTVIVKAIGIAVHTLRGRYIMDKARKINWHNRLTELEDPSNSINKYKSEPAYSINNNYGINSHIENLEMILKKNNNFPKPSEIYNAVIIATYNESYEILNSTLEAIMNSQYDKNNMIILIAYEERGGLEIEASANKLLKKFGKYFKAFELVKHPSNLKNEVIGKGSNITYAGKYLEKWLKINNISYENVLVTTLDSDNRPHFTYFDYVTYEYIIHENRERLSYQPISLFLNNIWDAPAPMRVVATGNSFWNIISSMRPHTLRNFASHSQPMSALVKMDFWSKRTIVEDGHQYWRSYFYFNGDYAVIPVFVPIYQDAVLSKTYLKTLKAQFVQLRRWAYGASDIPYVASRIFTKRRKVKLFPSLARLIRLIDGHVTLASMSILVAFGGWIPLLVNQDSARSIVAHQLPEVVSIFQRFAMIGLLITVFLSFKMLPPRPPRYRRSRTIGMLLQWILMPFTAILYSSLSAFYAQTRLAIGKYLNNFDVTEKATHNTINKK